jgi:hypothetical protein
MHTGELELKMDQRRIGGKTEPRLPAIENNDKSFAYLIKLIKDLIIIKEGHNGC